MEFQHPEFLYYMLPPLFILFGFLLTQKESQATFFSEDVISKLRVSANMLTLKARNALFMLMGFFIIIALASPVIQEGKVEVKAKSADIMIALDISDSMLAEDVYPNRLKLAKQKSLELLALAPNERIGVIGFAKNSYLVSPLSFDHQAVSFLLRQLSTDSITEKGTNFLSMLEVVDKSVKKSSKKYLLILSDGGDKKDFSKEIAYAKEKDIAVFILATGTQKGAPIKLANGEFIKQNGNIIISKLNNNIASLATKSGGVYMQSVNSDEDVKAMLEEIESHSVKKELKSQEVARFIPLFYFPLALALFLLLIATSSMSKREKVHLPVLFFIISLFSFSPNAHAGLLDFMELKEAKSAYEKGEYEKSAQIYNKYAQETKKGESYYNAGNALYKKGKYKEALDSYQKATFKDKPTRAKNFANMGNSYAKLGTKENLQKAIESYKHSLSLQEDKNTKENLEAVKKALEKEKEQNQENQNNKDQNDKSQNKQKDNKDSDSKNQDKQNKNENQKDQKQKDQNKESNQNKEEKNQKDKEQQNAQQDKNKEQNNSKQKDKMNSKEKNEDKKKQAEDQNSSAQTDEKNQQEKLKELKEDEKKIDKQKTTPQPQEMHNMSDKEEEKWMGKLNQKSNTYLYKLNKNNSIKEDPNEKPW